MAFNVQTFKTRALSAVVFVAIMVVGLLWNQWSFLVLFSIIHFGCWVEYNKIIALIDPGYRDINPSQRYGFMLAGWGFMLAMTNNSFILKHTLLNSLGMLIVLVSGVVLPLFLVVLRKNPPVKNIGYSVLGLLYISLPWGLMIAMRCSSTGIIVPLVLMSSIWINDTMAYIVGSFIGKTPFSKISPKKTWEGTAGGAVLCVVAMVFVVYPAIARKMNVGILSTLQNATVVIIAAIAAIAGTTGDLLESKLKRMAGIKDSGQIMPGHGGFLDRFDSLLVATPFVWLYVLLANL